MSAVGEGVTGVVPGGRVALQVIWGRPHARESLGGLENLDAEWIHLGGSCWGGAFADRIAVPADRVVPLPDSVGWDDAAPLEPLAVALHAMELVSVQPGDEVVLVGPGPFVLLMVAIAKARGAARGVVAGLEGVDATRLAVAATVGADAAIAVPAGDAQPAAAAIGETVGSADVVVDGGGSPESTWTSIEVTGTAGRVALFGFTREATIEPLRQVIRKGLSLHAVSAARREHYGRAHRLIETGLVRPAAIVTHRLPLARVAEGFELAGDRIAAKVLLDP